jgi:Recombinase
MPQRGRPTAVPEAVRSRMLVWRDAGWSLGRIADQLNREGIRTATGGAGWYAQSVRQVIEAERRRRAEPCTGTGVSAQQQGYYPPKGISGNHLAAEVLGSLFGQWPVGRYWTNTTTSRGVRSSWRP